MTKISQTMDGNSEKIINDLKHTLDDKQTNQTEKCYCLEPTEQIIHGKTKRNVKNY